VFNATFNNISVIAWRPVLVVEQAGVTTNHGQATGIGCVLIKKRFVFVLI
jgi:hypothetical protein